MDLIGCPHCNERFLSRDAGIEHRSCPDCRAEMRTIAHRIPEGIVTPEISDSDHLEQVSRSIGGTPFHSWQLDPLR